MGTSARSIVRFASRAATVEALARDLAQRCDPDALTVVFASSDLDLAALGQALAARGVQRTVGALSSRVLGAEGFAAHGVTGFSLPGGRFVAADGVIEDAASFGLPDAREFVRRLREQLQHAGGDGVQPRFGLLLVDAEARCEERLIAALGTELSGIPVVGGSAGELYFNPAGGGPGTSRILYRGRGLRGAATLCLVATESNVAAYCHNHYVPGRRRIVITAADPARRVVQEIDGRPAAEVYAAKCGFRRPAKLAGDFAPHPAMVRIGGEYYARGIQRVHEDGSLEFACAIERGIVATLANPGDMVARLRQLFDTMRGAIGTPELVIGLDCAARTSYMEQSGLTGAIEELMQANAAVGFATLGEQYSTIHANNSLTCLGIAAD